MAEYDDLLPEEVYVEIPCEFCSELFPLELLIDHQSGCRPDLLHYQFEDNLPNLPVVTRKLPAKTVPKATVDLLDDDPDIVEVAVQKIISKTPLSSLIDLNLDQLKEKKIEVKPEKKEVIKSISDTLKKKETATNLPSANLKVGETGLIFDDSTMQESETKLMSYGSNATKDKRIEVEKPSFKNPSLPLLNNAEQKVIDNACDSFSDSDEGESLEDFWKRAEIKNAQRLKKTKLSNV